MEMSDNMQKLNGVIEHYKRHIGRATEANDNDKIMKCIMKLSRLPITVENLQKTGIGRVVNGLRKYDGNIGESAKSLVIQWKNVVKIEETENFYQRDENSDEEHDVSSVNDNEELQISQNITSSVASTSYYNNNINSNEAEINTGDNNESSDHGSSRHRHDKSKYKKSKKDKDSKKRKESNSTSTDDQGEGHISKKIKKEHKSENVKINKEQDKHEVPKTSHRESTHSSEEITKKDKKSSHSDKKKDKHKSSHKSESKSHKDKNESKSGHKDKSDSKKKSKDKIKEEYKPSTSTTSTSSSNNKTFEEALLGIDLGSKKQTKYKSKDRLSKSSSSERESSPISTSMKLAPLNLDPEELITNYKPLPQLDVKKKITIDNDPLATIMTTKNMRTKVYSGNKSIMYSEVPTLIDICVQTIKDNLDALEFTGGVPFDILEPILKHATPIQLYVLENYNDYLIEDTGKLWEYHCKKEFRSEIPKKNESWRNCYLRCQDERKEKLDKIRSHINANKAASTPVRKTQLAYVDSVVKPPRGVAKKQAKYNTASSDIKRNILNKSMMGGNSTAEALSSNNKPTTMATGVPIALTPSHSSSSSIKKKIAPLMQKTIKLIKSTRRR